MHFILKKLSIVFLAVVVMSVVGSASASAEACKKKAGSKIYSLCIAGEKLGSPTEERSAAIAGQLRSGTVGRIAIDSQEGPWMKITCSNVATSALFSSGVKSASISKLDSGFSHCKLLLGSETEPRCDTTEHFTWSDRASFPGPLAEDVTLHAEEHSYFGLVNVGNLNGCPSTALGIWELLGSPECSLANAETETIEKTLVCKGDRSHLQVRQNKAPGELEYEEVISLTGPNSGKKFSVVETQEA
jgi:hypothetical protein